MTVLESCQQLLLRLQRREPVAARELKRALGEEHWEEYERRREWVVALREKAKIASYELRNYVNMLRIADLRDAQADRMRVRRGKSMPRGKRPSDLYERALEHLSERIEENGSLYQYLDRPFTPYVLDCTTDIGEEKERVPRLWYTTAASAFANFAKAADSAQLD
jgi:chromatin segregation and condensation protein Rec8/ScpA/Scc1 (kleisin family)